MADDARGYGYRTRDDSLPPLGVQPRPLTDADLLGGVAAAAAQGALPTTGGAVSTAAIILTSTGLVFRDRFDRADGALGADWTTINGTWAIVSLLARGTPAATSVENVIASVLAAAAERVVQSTLRVSAAAATAAIRARWDGAAEAASNSYLLELVAGVGFNLKKQIAGAYTMLASSALTTLAANVLYGVKLHVKNGQQNAYANGSAIAATTDTALDAATGKAGLRSENTGAGAPTTDADDFAVYLSNTVSITGLPTGYSLRLAGQTVVGVAGSAAVNLGGAMCPLQSIEVLDELNQVSATLVPTAGIWGGDVYAYLPVTTPAGVTVTPTSDSILTVAWSAIADADAYKVEWHNGNGIWAALPDVPAPLTTVQQTGLTEGTLRVFRVSAYRAGGVSSASDPVSGTTLLANVINLTIAGTPAAGSIVLTWTDRSALESGYQLQRSQDGSAFADFGALLAANTLTTTDTTATNGHTYNYRLATVGANGSRNYSNETSCNLSGGAITGGIARTSTGLLFFDDFTRANATDLGPNWDSGGATLVSNRASLIGSLVASPTMAALALRRDMHVQAVMQRVTGLGYFAVLHARFSNINNMYQYDHRVGAGPPQAYVRVGGGFGLLGTGTFSTDAAGADHRMTLSALNTSIMCWTDGVLQVNAVDTNLPGTGTAALDVSGGGEVLVDEISVCSDRVITCTNLPVGWFIRRGGTGEVSGFSAGGGTPVTLDPLGAALPIATIDVCNGAGVVQQNYTPSGGVWGGDVLDWTGAISSGSPVQTVPIGTGAAGTYDGIAITVTPGSRLVTTPNGRTVRTMAPTGSVFDDATGGSTYPASPGQTDPYYELDFNSAIASFTVSIVDSSKTGNRMIAYDALGNVLGTVTFGFSTIDSSPRELTITFAGIRAIILQSAANDKVAWFGMSFTH